MVDETEFASIGEVIGNLVRILCGRRVVGRNCRKDTALWYWAVALEVYNRSYKPYHTEFIC